MSRAFRLAAALVALPALATAQPGTGSIGQRAGALFGRGGRDAGVPAPTIVNAVNLLIQHRGELALTDSQFVRIIALKRSTDSANVPLMRRIDSLQRSTRASTDPTMRSSDAERARDARAEMRETVKEVYATIQPARDRAFALLTEAQLDRAKDIESRARKQADDATAAAGPAGRRGAPPD